MKINTRIAPTPSGYLHLGNLFSFVLTWLIARKNPQGGTILLRLDDIDAKRTRRAYVEDIFETLYWLGLDWDKGPKSAEEFYQQYAQILSLAHYKKLAEDLLQKQIIYPCTCSRKDLLNKVCECKHHIPFSKKILENRHYKFSALQDAIVEIKDVKKGNTSFDLTNTQLSNFNLWTKDNLPAYMLVSVCEDAFHEINFIVRGEDLWQTTAAQLALYKKIKGLTFKDKPLEHFDKVSFLHHPLLLETHGAKLSKSAGATAVQKLREEYSQSDFFNFVAKNLGIKEACPNLATLLQYFDLETYLSAKTDSMLFHTFSAV